MSAKSEASEVVIEVSGGQLWFHAVVAGAAGGAIILIGWFVIEKIQDWWDDYQESKDPGTLDTTSLDPVAVEPYTPTVDEHMAVAKGLINDVQRDEAEVSDER